MNSVKGSYTILSEGKVLARFNNLITNIGRDYLTTGSSKSVRKSCTLSADISEPSVNRVNIPVSSTLTFQSQENGFRNLSNQYRLSFSKLIFKGNSGSKDLKISKVGIKFNNELISEALIKDSDKKVLELIFKANTEITVIYEISILHHLLPVSFETPYRTLTVSLDESLDGKVLNLIEPLKLLPEHLDPKFDYVLNKISPTEFSVYVETKGPLLEKKDTLKIPTNRGIYLISIKDKRYTGGVNIAGTEEDESLYSNSFPADGEDFYFTLHIGLRYD